MITSRAFSRLALSVAAMGLVACAEPAMSPELDVAPLLKAGGKPGGGSTTWNGGAVTSSIASGNAGYAGVGGTYVTASGVVSEVQSIGDWVLETNGRKSTRYVDVTLDASTAVMLGSQALPFTGTQRVQGRFISRISLTDPAAGPTRYQDMNAVDQSKDVPLAFAFDFGGKSYRITMNPGQDPNINPSPNLALTDWVSATCTAVSGTQCSAWSLLPTAEGGNTGLLMLVSNSGTSDVALVRMDFAIAFTR